MNLALEKEKVPKNKPSVCGFEVPVLASWSGQVRHGQELCSCHLDQVLESVSSSLFRTASNLGQKRLSNRLLQVFGRRSKQIIHEPLEDLRFFRESSDVKVEADGLPDLSPQHSRHRFLDRSPDQVVETWTSQSFNSPVEESGAAETCARTCKLRVGIRRNL